MSPIHSYQYRNGLNWVSYVTAHIQQVKVTQSTFSHSSNYISSPWYTKSINQYTLALLQLCNSYTMFCPPVRGDNPQALAGHPCYNYFIPLTSVWTNYKYEILHTKVGKGGLKMFMN